MVRQISVFSWNGSATPERIEALERELAQLPARIPTITSYFFGSSLGLTQGSADFAVVADSASEEDWRAYIEHPAHVAVVNDFLQPLIATRMAIQVRS